MKCVAVAAVAIVGALANGATWATGMWLTFFLGHSYFWLILVAALSLGEVNYTYKVINAIGVVARIKNG